MNQGESRPAVVGLGLALLVIVPVSLYGGKHELAIQASFGLVLLLVLAAKRLPAERWTAAGWLLVAFVGWTLIHTFLLSSRPFASLIAFLPLLAGALIFLLLQVRPPSSQTVRIFITLLLAGVSIIALVGLHIYLSYRFPSLRMGGAFRQHNAWAGFLVGVLPLALYFSLFEKAKYLRLLGRVAGALVLVSLILTFSRGGWLAAGLTLLVFFALVWRQASLKHIARPVAVFLIMATASGLIAYGLYAVKLENFSTVGLERAASPYAGERPEEGETGANARFQYWRAATKIWSERPLVGYGLDTFGQEYRRTQTDPRFYSLDPHNLLFKLLAEQGLIGTIIFTLFIFALLWPRLKNLWWWRPENNLAGAALFSGALGLLLHYGLDLDLTFPAHYIVFFSIAGLAAVPGADNAEGTTTANPNGKAYLYSALIAASLIGFASVVSLYLSNYQFQQALFASEDGDIAEFELRLKRSGWLNPINPGRALTVAEFLFDAGQFQQALAWAERAKAIHPKDSYTRFLLGRILAALERNNEAENEYRLAIAFTPARDLESYVYLTNLLIEMEQEAAARQVAQAGLAIFTDELFGSALWVHPSKETVRFHQTLLKTYAHPPQGSPLGFYDIELQPIIDQGIKISAVREIVRESTGG